MRQIMGSQDAAVSCYLAEWYTPALPDHPIADIARCLRQSLTIMAAECHQLELLYAVEVPGDAYAFGVFAADSADLVARACLHAGLPADRVTAATQAPQ
jgi:hypothetical protein